MPSLKVLGHWAELYQCSVSDLLVGVLDFSGKGDMPGGGTVSGVAELHRPNRRSVLAGLAGAGLVVTGPRQRLGRVGAADLERYHAQVSALWHEDEAQGGGAVYRDVLGLLGQVRAVLDQGSYGVTVGRDLQVVAGQLTELAAFTAFDAGDHDVARRHFHEALAVARVADDADLETYVLAQMANQASWLRNGRETVELAQAAQRRARGPARLTAVLAAREAEGHAMRGDAGQAHAALSRSERELADASNDGNAWFGYFEVPTLQTMAAQVYLSLDAPVAAERAARESVAPDLARRPRALHCVRHARALVAARQLDQARHVVGEADTLAEGISSARLAGDLAVVHRALASA